MCKRLEMFQIRILRERFEGFLFLQGWPDDLQWLAMDPGIIAGMQRDVTFCALVQPRI